ncbi:carbohydrate esterase family 16 protein [Patellaria atrata CBS 101060]|uniref:Carbohydrate esterase family 16 protein n=1 Tax=Patellaria atrata CBS 101060 TaxID=1346257 RepID=A0A9P4S6L8_9PEZI|nr:carbohydrate esterase family 16 protein [Patellaria atrata CBS 101060]
MRLPSPILLGITLCVQLTLASPRDVWSIRKLRSLVAFGDSYTDESRLGYFYNNNGSAPPVGWIGPEGAVTASGGRVWARYVSQYTGAKLYNYAVSGAVCSNAVTPRWFGPINDNFPAVAEYEVPAFIADSHHRTHRKPTLDISASQTVYSIWIGTNDLGNYAFLTDSQVKGKTISDYLDCVYGQLEKLYKNGARYFVIMNAAPLELLPQYAPMDAGGLATTQFWPDKWANITAAHEKIKEYVALVNDNYKYRTPYETKVKRRYPGAHFAVFDTYDLLSDIYYNPTRYLNGTGPPNVQGYQNHCVNNTCTPQGDPDAYLWYDELHPSEQTDRIIAKNFVDVVNGRSKWATYWSD